MELSKFIASPASLEIAFSRGCGRAGWKFFFVNQSPWETMSGRARFSGIVSAQSIGKVGAGTDISPAGFAAPQDVNRKHALAQASG
jgi:hypothetical protein